MILEKRHDQIRTRCSTDDKILEYLYTHENMHPVIIAHGGIEFGHSGYATNEKQIALKDAVIQGYAILRVGRSSVDAVEKTIRILENDEHFNAGYGSVFNSDGEIELDAGIMNGTDSRAGSVGGVKDIRHPITLAKHVMESTDHSLLVGDGARRFAVEQEVPILSPGSLVHSATFDDLCELPGSQETCTVGVVAIDTAGSCAVGTSSGGGWNKMPGRIGSSAIVGGGFWADSLIGGSVATGHGESIMKSCLCFDLVSQMAAQKLRGDLAMLAVKNVIETVTRQSKNSVGSVALYRNGDFGVAFSAPRMPWAYCRLGELRFGAESGENYQEYL